MKKNPNIGNTWFNLGLMLGSFVIEKTLIMVLKKKGVLNE